MPNAAEKHGLKQVDTLPVVERGHFAVTQIDGKTEVYVSLDNDFYYKHAIRSITAHNEYFETFKFTFSREDKGQKLRGETLSDKLENVGFIRHPFLEQIFFLFHGGFEILAIVDKQDHIKLYKAFTPSQSNLAYEAKERGQLLIDSLTKEPITTRKEKKTKIAYLGNPVSYALEDDLSAIEPSLKKAYGFQRTQDVDSSFHLYGSNTNGSIRVLQTINGISISDLETRMRPGRGSIDEFVKSEDGFLGKDEGLIDLLVRDNTTVLNNHGLTHLHVAYPLLVIQAAATKNLFRTSYSSPPRAGFYYNDTLFRLDHVLYGGKQSSPFGDELESGIDYYLANTETGQRLMFSGLIPPLIARYGFYEGFGTPYRVSPEEIIRMFNITNEIPYK